MTVKPKKGITVDDLTNLIDEHDGLFDAIYGTEVEDDLSRVRFDLENLERFGSHVAGSLYSVVVNAANGIA